MSHYLQELVATLDTLIFGAEHLNEKKDKIVLLPVDEFCNNNFKHRSHVTAISGDLSLFVGDIDIKIH